MIKQSVLKAILFTPGFGGRWGLPALFTGLPGVAKSGVISQVCARYGLHCEVIIGSAADPMDIGGLCRLEGDRFVRVPESWALEMAEKHPHAVVFADEATCNPPAMQAPMLRMVYEGCLGRFQLPGTVRIIAAANPPDVAAGGWEISPPMANRMLHLEWHPPTVDEFARHILGGGGLPVQEESAVSIEARVMQAWPEAFAKAAGLVTSFLKARPSLLHTMPKEGAGGEADAAKGASRDGAWPSPRTWELAIRALAGADIHRLDEVDADELLAGAVGLAASAELAEYRSKADLPSPEDVLDEKVKFEHDPLRLDRTAAVLSSCAALVAPEKAAKRKERVAALWKVVHSVVKAGAADVCVHAGMVLARRGLVHGKEARQALAVLQPILAAAGFRADRE